VSRAPHLGGSLSADRVIRDPVALWNGGPVLRSFVAPDALWMYWEGLLPRYAEAQLGLAEHRPRLLASGAPNLGLRDCPWSIAGCWLSSLPGPPRMAG
jgi:hypothetical protein